MDRLNAKNFVSLCGTVCGRPNFSHTAGGRRYFSFPLTVSRLSGAEDRIIISCRDDLLEGAFPDDGDALHILGELRSYNNKSGIGNRLQISVFAFELEFCDDEPENTVYLSGTICKPPKLRQTPLGREICDLLIAVNRPLGRSDYLPCICWGQSAQEAAGFAVGQSIELDGRIQSRDYIKLIEGEQYRKTAFEVSAVSVRCLNRTLE